MTCSPPSLLPVEWFVDSTHISQNQLVCLLPTCIQMIFIHSHYNADNKVKYCVGVLKLHKRKENLFVIIKK